MNILEQARPQTTPIPGVSHATWAGAADGLSQLSVWRQTLAPGAALSMRPPETAGCRFDLRLVLQGGQEEIRRDADVCRDRQVVVGGGASATAPATPSLPQVGGGDRLLPSIGGRD